MNRSLYFIVVLFSALGLAESSASLKAKSRVPKIAAQFYGNLELRPGIATTDGAFATENTFDIGAKLKPTLSLGYQQEINTNASNLEENAGTPVFGDGFGRVKVDEIAKLGEAVLAYEARVYVPTDPGKRDAGMVTAIRNYLKVSRKITDSVSFGFQEIPIIHIYSQDESETTLKANPAFENRVVLSMGFQLSKAVSLSIPFFFYLTRYRDSEYTNIANAGEWSPSLFLWPELTYQMSPAVYMGAAYRTDSFVTTSDDGIVAGDNFGGGMVQAVFGVNF